MVLEMKLLANNCKNQAHQLTEALTDAPKLPPYLKIVSQLPSQKDRLKKLCLHSAQRHRPPLHHKLQYYGISHFRMLRVTTCSVANHQLHFEVNTNTSHGLHVWKLWKMSWHSSGQTTLATQDYLFLNIPFWIINKHLHRPKSRSLVLSTK